MGAAGFEVVDKNLSVEEQHTVLAAKDSVQATLSVRLRMLSRALTGTLVDVWSYIKAIINIAGSATARSLHQSAFQGVAGIAPMDLSSQVRPAITIPTGSLCRSLCRQPGFDDKERQNSFTLNLLRQ